MSVQVRPNGGHDAAALLTPTPLAVHALPDVLGELIYPAQNWQVVTTAELFGVDTVTLSHLWALPRGTYYSLDHIVHVLTHPAPAAQAPVQSLTPTVLS